MYNPHEVRSIGRRTVPFVPWPSQIETSDWLDRQRQAGEEALMLKSRKLGITWEILHKMAWSWMLEPDFSALLGSKKEDTVDRRGDSDSLFDKLRWLLLLQPAHLLPPGWHDPKRRRHWDKHLVLKNPANGAEITGEATHENFGAAGRRSVVFIDEAGRVESRILHQIWKSVETVGGSLWMVFNATPSAGHAVNVFISAISPHKVRTLTWRADPRRPKNFPELKRLPIGRLTQEEFDEIYDCKSGATATGNAFRLNRAVTVYHDKSDGFDPKSRDIEPLYAAFDFGTGPKSLACIMAMIQWGTRPVIRIEQALSCPGKTPFLDFLEEIEAVRKTYGNPSTVTGDPAGGQTQRDARSYVADLRDFGYGWVPLQPVVEPGDDPLAINTTPWKRWAIKMAQSMMDDGTLLIHERCEDVLLWAIDRWSWNVPKGATVEDIRGYGELLKDLPSHACEAFLYVFSYCLMTIEETRARAAAKPSRTRDPGGSPRTEDLMGRGRL